ncbi:cysteine desulfurase [Cohaesibacter intestini]|uniref:cysteine desulfurase n=1 Tax=Cohaesibacter intestini TaxID=2211145 RepID=UPI000DE9C02D|nr:cysteine desulfurase [Cohaesibacter intestini]
MQSPILAPVADYDVDAIRADFPILSREVYGKPLVYLDNGASAQKPQVVIDAVTRCYSEEYANVHRGLHFLSNTATDNFEAAREKVRRFLNAPSVDNIVFTRSSTEAINLVAQSYGSLVLKEGDEIILSIMEHHSNIVPWNFFRERLGVVIKWAPVDEDGNFLMDEFEALLTERTKIVAITQMSNALGTIVPVKEVIEKAHAAGAKVLVDGSQSAVHMPIDVQDLDADFFAMTGHKLYGPSGIGVLYGKAELLDAMPPFMGGGEMIKDVTLDGVTYGVPPHKFEAGTPPIAQAIGLGAALDYIDGIGRDRIAAHEEALKTYAHEKLSGINSLRIIGQAKDKGAIVSFEMEGIHAHDISMVIDRSGVAVRAGTHCAQPLLTRFGVTSTCRASFGLYNRKEEVDALAEALMKAQAFFS